jgi:prepilin peptidase CpaA
MRRVFLCNGENMTETVEISAIVVLIVTGTAAIIDLHKGIIPNRITYPAALIGLGFGVINQFHNQTPGILESLTGLIGALVITGLLMVIGAIGGGDVKLMAAIGALMGFPFVLQAGVRIVVAGALISLTILVLRGQLYLTLQRIAGIFTGYLGFEVLRNGQDLTNRTIPFGPAIFLGVIVTIIERGYHRAIAAMLN